MHETSGGTRGSFHRSRAVLRRGYIGGGRGVAASRRRRHAGRGRRCARSVTTSDLRARLAAASTCASRRGRPSARARQRKEGAGLVVSGRSWDAELGGAVWGGKGEGQRGAARTTASSEDVGLTVLVPVARPFSAPPSWWWSCVCSTGKRVWEGVGAKQLVSTSMTSTPAGKEGRQRTGLLLELLDGRVADAVGLDAGLRVAAVARREKVVSAASQWGGGRSRAGAAAHTRRGAHSSQGPSPCAAPSCPARP